MNELSVPVSASGPDIETLLAAHQHDIEERVNADDPSLRDYGAICSCRKWNAFDDGGYHRAHVAGVLRAHIVTTQADAWEVGHDSCGIRHSCENPYRAALVGQIGADHD